MTPCEQLLQPEFLHSHVLSRLPDADPERYRVLVDRLVDEGVGTDRPVFFVSAPGRTELAGGHTDHNRGTVLAGSVQLDTIAAIAPRSDMKVNLLSEGFPRVEVTLDDLGPVESERETTGALIRGVAAWFAESGFLVGGFDATVSSHVLPGSGLSSSASVEVLIGTAFDHGWNRGSVGPLGVSLAGKYAENVFFGKPSGLMDQVACAHGGIVFIDFKDEMNPVITPVSADFRDAGLAILVVDTGGSHADLTNEYAAIPAEMKAVAKYLGRNELADTDVDQIVRSLGTLRDAVGDRAVSRALHFHAEVLRVEAMVEALHQDDYRRYAHLMSESGRSSGMYLQNGAPASSPENQGMVVALALTDLFFGRESLLPGENAASRIQGGGFAGTILVLMPSDLVNRYRTFLEPTLGSNAVTEIRIRSTGAVAW